MSCLFELPLWQFYMYKFVFNVMMTFSKAIILDYSVFKEQKGVFVVIEIACLQVKVYSR